MKSQVQLWDIKQKCLVHWRGDVTRDERTGQSGAAIQFIRTGEVRLMHADGPKLSSQNLQLVCQAAGPESVLYLVYLGPVL